VNENRKDKNRDVAATDERKRAPKHEQQPKQRDEQFDERALDEVMRDCPL
jgi:hypothetical protein